MILKVKDAADDSGMERDPTTHGLWAQTAPKPVECPALDGAKTADIAIVGGGYTGLSAALELAERGLSVRLLEAVSIGHGGSGRNVGLVNAGLWVRPSALLDLLGPLYGPRLLHVLGNGPSEVFARVERHGMECEAVRNGTLHCGVGEDGARELSERATEWQAHGAPVELLDASATQGAVGSTAYRAALLDRRAGTIQPLAYARGLARAAQEAGAWLHADSPVRSVTRSGAAWTLSTPGGSVTAARILVATNAYTKGLWPQLREELVHLPYFNFATVPLPGTVRETILPGGQGCWDTKDVLTSFRFDAANRLVLGSVGALRGAGRPIHERWARATLRRLFPTLGPIMGKIAFDSAWYGMIGMTADAVPRFHRLDEGVVSVSGYNGRGIAPGTVFGRLMAGHLAGEIAESELPLPVTPPTAQSFRALREGFYEYGAQIAHLTSKI